MTNVGQAFLALLAGFSVTAVVVIVVTAVLQKSVPGWVGTGARPRPAYVVVNLGYSFLAAAAGGYVTAWIAGFGPLRAVLALSIIVLVLGAISALQSKGKQPLWYQMALLIITSIGVVAGGLVRLRVAGIL